VHELVLITILLVGLLVFGNLHRGIWSGIDETPQHPSRN
jgi:hypothetical protein